MKCINEVSYSYVGVTDDGWHKFHRKPYFDEFLLVSEACYIRETGERQYLKKTDVYLQNNQIEPIE